MKSFSKWLLLGLLLIPAAGFLAAQNNFPLQHWPRPYFTSLNGTFNFGNAFAGSTSAGKVSNVFSTNADPQFVVMTPDMSGTGGSSAGITTTTGAVIEDLRSGQVSWYLNNGGNPVTPFAITPTGVKVNGQALSANPRSVLSAFIPTLTATVTGATFTPDTAITVTRIEAQVDTAPVTCAPNAVVTVTDGTTPQTVTIAALANDSGALTQAYAAGVPITIGISTAAAGCGTPPTNANVLVQYEAQ